MKDTRAVCMACPLARCNGACVCTLDGRDIDAHAAAADCPKGYHAGVPIPPPSRGPVPMSEWPRLARLIAWRRHPGEAGVGDTLHRLIGNVDGEALAAWYERIVGKPCGCKARRRKLNRLYPYPTT